MIDRTQSRRCRRGSFTATALALGLLSLASTPSSRAQTGTLTAIATFNGFANGTDPVGGVTFDRNGNLFGTTLGGGANNDGTVFEVAAGTHTLTAFATFNGIGNGSDPSANVTFDSSGNMYGTTSTGGANNQGTVFKIAAGTNVITTIATFNGTNGIGPRGPLTFDGSGNLYGTTYSDGSTGEGTVFEIVAGTSSITTLAKFTGANGAYPFSGVTVDGSGNLYGTTDFGGNLSVNSGQGFGTVYKIASGTNTITTLATFNGPNGENTFSGLVTDGSGNFYGSTIGGGTFSQGTIYKIAAGTNAMTTLLSFNYADGADPIGDLTVDGNGNLYGTTNSGGTKSDGTVFEIAVGTSAVTTLGTFSGANGDNPWSKVTIDSNGDLYGTTTTGGNLSLGNGSGYGAVFEIKVAGATAPEPYPFALFLSTLPIVYRYFAKRGRRVRQ